MSKDLKIEHEGSPKFELVLQIRDHNGTPTGKIKSFVTDDAEELDKYWQRNNGTKKVKSKKKKFENKQPEKQPE